MLAVFAALLVLIPGLGWIDDPSLELSFDKSRAAPPPTHPGAATARNPERTAFFGDLHVHTSYSSDAFICGVRALPHDAYVFAKRGTIEHGACYPIRIAKPLDFLAVTDHAEFLGTVRAAWPDIPATRKPLREGVFAPLRAAEPIGSKSYAISLAFLISAAVISVTSCHQLRVAGMGALLGRGGPIPRRRGSDGSINVCGIYTESARCLVGVPGRFSPSHLESLKTSRRPIAMTP